MRGQGGGRPPKPEGQKVNRNAPTREPLALPADPVERECPAPLVELDENGSRLWVSMWARPEAALWKDVDVPALSRLVFLQLDASAWTDSKLLAEMRQMEDRFLMNPYARRLAGVKVNEPDMAAPKPAGRPRLRVVDAG